MNYNKHVKIDCDDEMFMSGEIILSWKTEDQLKDSSLRICKLELDLQYGRIAILRYEEIEELILKLEMVKERLKP